MEAKRNDNHIKAQAISTVIQPESKALSGNEARIITILFRTLKDKEDRRLHPEDTYAESRAP